MIAQAGYIGMFLALASVVGAAAMIYIYRRLDGQARKRERDTIGSFMNFAKKFKEKAVERN